MFKKSLKTFALVATTWTAAEFITMWRLEPTPMTLPQFTKSWLKSQREGVRYAYNGGALVTIDPEAGSKALKRLAFPNRPQK